MTAVCVCITGDQPGIPPSQIARINASCEAHGQQLPLIVPEVVCNVGPHNRQGIPATKRVGTTNSDAGMPVCEEHARSLIAMGWREVKARTA